MAILFFRCCGDHRDLPSPPTRRSSVLEVRHYPRVPDPQKLIPLFSCVLTNLKNLRKTIFSTFPLPLPLTLYPQGDAQSISCVAPGEPDNALQLMHRVLLHAENNVILRDYQSAGAPSGIPPRGNGRPFPHRLGECIGNGVQSPSLFYGRDVPSARINVLLNNLKTQKLCIPSYHALNASAAAPPAEYSLSSPTLAASSAA